jgi:hypothetical protein
MDNSDDLTFAQGIALIGILLLLIIPLATALAAWFKHRFAQAVVRLQAQTAASEPAADETAPDARLLRPITAQGPRQPAPPPDLVFQRAVDVPQSPADPVRPARRLRAWVLGVQLVFGVAYWIWLFISVLAIFSIVQESSSDTPAAESPTDYSLLGWSMALVLLFAPPVLAWALQAGVRTRWLWTGLATSLALVGVSALSHMTPMEAAGTVAVFGLLGLMMLTFMRPSVRGAGPPLVAALVVGWLVLCALVVLVDWAARGTALESALSINATGEPSGADWAVGIVALLLALGPSVWAGWRALRRIARRYAQKRFSEVQLALGAYWFLITAHGVGLLFFLNFDDRFANADTLSLALLLLFFWWLWRACQRVVLA